LHSFCSGGAGVIRTLSLGTCIAAGVAFSCYGEFGATLLSVVLLLDIWKKDGVGGADVYDGYYWRCWRETLKSLLLSLPYVWCFVSLLFFPLSLGPWNRGNCNSTAAVLVAAVVFGKCCVALFHYRDDDND